MKRSNCAKPKHTENKLRHAVKNTHKFCCHGVSPAQNTQHCNIIICTASTPLPRPAEMLLRVYLQVIVKSQPNSPLTYLSDDSGDWACFLMQFILVLCPSPSLLLLNPSC